MINAKDSKNTFYILNQKDNTPIVLIHGVGLNHKIWEPQINSFNNTVLVYDILGHGNTPLTKSKISFDDFSSQLLNLIDELKIIAMQISERNGQLIGAAQVTEDDELMLISDKGMLVRTRVSEVNIIGRNTQGVIVIRLKDSEKLISIAPISEEFIGDE